MRTRLVLRPLAAASLFAAIVACSSSSALPGALGGQTGTHPPPSGGGGDDASDSGTSDGATCPSLENDATQISVTNVPESVPAAIGGTIATGDYYETAANYYTGVSGTAGPTGEIIAQTLSLTDATFVFALATGNAEAGTVGDSAITAGTYSASGNTLTLDQTCPLVASSSVTYSVDGNTIHLFSGQLESIFTQQ